MYPWLVEMYYIHADKKGCNSGTQVTWDPAWDMLSLDD